MRTQRWFLLGLMLVLSIGMMLPAAMAVAEENSEVATLRLAGICETCGVNADCDSGNCGVAADGTRKCIPANAVSYECSVGSDSCFIDVVEMSGKAPFVFETNLP